MGLYIFITYGTYMIAARLVSNILPFTIPEEKKENKDFTEAASRKEIQVKTRHTKHFY